MTEKLEMESEFSGERAMHDADPTDRIIVMNKPDLMMLWLAAELSSELREKEEITLWIPKPRSFLSKVGVETRRRTLSTQPAF